MRVFDDDFDEADEEVFIIALTVDNSNLVGDTNTARLQRQTSLCIIQDNDGKSSSVILYACETFYMQTFVLDSKMHHTPSLSLKKHRTSLLPLKSKMGAYQNRPS